MSSLSAPASGAPCGTAIIRMADEKVVSRKEAPGMGGKEGKMELKASPHPPPMFTTQQEGTKKKKTGKTKILMKDLYLCQLWTTLGVSFWWMPCN